MPRKAKPKKVTKDKSLYNFFYNINSWNAKPLADALERWLANDGYEVKEK